MLLTIDVGNTNIVIGVFEGEDLKCELRLQTDLRRTADEYASSLLSLFPKKLGSNYAFEGAVISSVVPQITGEIRRLVEGYLGVSALLVEPGIKTGIALNIDDPRTAGADRIVNALAMKHYYGTPGIVIDFGTATTFDVVGIDGSYEGGIIAPGIGLSMSALVKNTAKLPQIELQYPSRTIGKTTVECMQSGAVLGYICLVDGLIERIRQEYHGIKHIVATGGFGGLITKHSHLIKTHDPYLTLKGLVRIYSLNKGREK